MFDVMNTLYTLKQYIRKIFHIASKTFSFIINFKCNLNVYGFHRYRTIINKIVSFNENCFFFFFKVTIGPQISY